MLRAGKAFPREIEVDNALNYGIMARNNKGIKYEAL